MEIELSAQTLAYAIGGILLVGGAAVLFPSSFRMFGEWLNDGDVPPLPPLMTHGICEHVELVCATAYAAPPDIQLDYLRKGLNQLEVLQAEVQRLAPPPSSPAGPAA